MTRPLRRRKNATGGVVRDEDVRYRVWLVQRITSPSDAALPETLVCRESLTLCDLSWRSAMLVAEGFNRTICQGSTEWIAVVLPAGELARFHGRSPAKSR